MKVSNEELHHRIDQFIGWIQRVRDERGSAQVILAVEFTKVFAEATTIPGGSEMGGMAMAMGRIAEMDQADRDEALDLIMKEFEKQRPPR